MSFELPPELWLKVFQSLPMDTIQNVHVVSSLFYDLSCGFLFNAVTLYPATFGDEAFDKRVTDRGFEQLAFWSSEKIATHIRSFTVNLARTEMSIVVGSCPSLVSACFEAVSRFKNLRMLTCSLSSSANIEIPALHVDALPFLRSLHIHGGRLVRPTSPLIQLKIEDFFYTKIPSTHPLGALESPIPYLSVLDPTSLRRLYLRSGSMISIEHFLENMAPYQNLRSLDLSLLEPTNVNRLHTWISTFPAIHDLTVSLVLNTDSADTLPSTPLTPHLRTYTGPPDLVPLVLRGTPAPRGLTIIQYYAPELLHALRASGSEAYPSLTSLTMRALYPDLGSPSLRDALAFFPNLRALTISVYSARRGRPWRGSAASIASPESRELCERLATVFDVVALLDTVVLDWWVESGYWGQVIPPLEELEATLVLTLPNLKRVLYGSQPESDGD
ncbi:hypothetical protein DFH08DRAFT_903755, partial [Mycena albidolilacea]